MATRFVTTVTWNGTDWNNQPLVELYEAPSPDLCRSAATQGLRDVLERTGYALMESRIEPTTFTMLWQLPDSATKVWVMGVIEQREEHEC